jgi:hypothetical protein
MPESVGLVVARDRNRQLPPFRISSSVLIAETRTGILWQNLPAPRAEGSSGTRLFLFCTTYPIHIMVIYCELPQLRPRLTDALARRRLKRRAVPVTLGMAEPVTIFSRAHRISRPVAKAGLILRQWIRSQDDNDMEYDPKPPSVKCLQAWLILKYSGIFGRRPKRV